MHGVAMNSLVRQATLAVEESRRQIGPDHIKLDRQWPLESMEKVEAFRVAVKPFYSRIPFKVHI
jgi:hypothetical protein